MAQYRYEIIRCFDFSNKISWIPFDTPVNILKQKGENSLASIGCTSEMTTLKTHYFLKSKLLPPFKALPWLSTCVIVAQQRVWCRRSADFQICRFVVWVTFHRVRRLVWGSRVMPFLKQTCRSQPLTPLNPLPDSPKWCDSRTLCGTLLSLFLHRAHHFP